MEGMEQAVREVIQLKQAYEQGGDKGAGERANQIRSQYGIDENLYGGDVSLVDALSNFTNQFGNKQQQSGGQQQPTQQGQGGSQGFNQEEMFGKMQDMFQQSSSDYYDSQKAQLDSLFQQQIQELEMAYAEAIQNGEMSVRDAQRAFEEQKGQIEQSVYQQAQATKAYGNEMGIGHSQQMMGLQAGDNARANSIHNANAKDRDNRVADIKDRMNMIKHQKDLQIAGAQLQHGYALAGADAQARQMYSEQMGQFGMQDYFNQQQMGHDRDMQQDRFGHDRDMQQDRFGHEINVEGIRHNNNLALNLQQHGFNLDILREEHKNLIETIDIQHSNFLEGLDVQHGYNIEELMENISGQLKVVGAQNSGAMARLNRQAEIDSSRDNAQWQRELTMYDKKVEDGRKNFEFELRAQLRNKKLEDNYELSQLEKSLDPNTRLGQATLKQVKQQQDMATRQFIDQTMMDYSMANIFENPDLKINVKGVKSIWSIGRVITEMPKRKKLAKAQSQVSDFFANPSEVISNNVGGGQTNWLGYPKKNQEVESINNYLKRLNLP